MSNVLFSMKQDKVELRRQKVTATSVEVATTKFLLGMRNCTVDSDIGTGILHVCGYVHMRLHVPPGME